MVNTYIKMILQRHKAAVCFSALKLNVHKPSWTGNSLSSVHRWTWIVVI